MEMVKLEGVTIAQSALRPQRKIFCKVLYAAKEGVEPILGAKTPQSKTSSFICSNLSGSTSNDVDIPVNDDDIHPEKDSCQLVSISWIIFLWKL